MPPFRVYPDTNVALHYKPYEDVDWCALVGSKPGNVVVVITSVFLREIDEQKDRGRGVIQGRARRVSSWLGQIRREKRTELRPGVDIEVDPREPEVSIDMASTGLTPTVNDDKVVACMLRDHAAHPSATLVCVTADNTLAYKVTARNFTVVEPLDADRLPDQPDPHDAEKRDLQRQLIDLKRRVNARPELNLRFNGGAEHVEFTARLLEPRSDEEVQEYLASRSAMLLDDSPLGVVQVFYQPPSKEAVAHYVDDLQPWLEWRAVDSIARGLTFRVELRLLNGGGGNADDIDIDLTVPEHVFVGRRRKLPTGPKKPEPPRSRSKLDLFDARAQLAPFLARGTIDVGVISRTLRESNEPIRFVELPNEPHRVHIHVKSLKHQTEVSLVSFEAWFETPESVGTGFAIAYRIHAASTPDIREGKLHVRLKVEHGRASLRDRQDDLSDPEDEEDGG